MSDKMTRQEVIDNYIAQTTFNNLKQGLADLQKRHKEAASRSDKIQLTKEINLIEAHIEEMKDSFTRVHIINPKRMLDFYIMMPLESLKSDYQKKLENFQKMFASNPTSAIENHADGLIKAQVKIQKVEFILSVMGQAEDDLGKIEKFILAWTHILEDSKNTFGCFLRRGDSKSSSQYSNCVESSKVTALAEIEDRDKIAGAIYMLEELENWKILKEEGLLTEEN